MKLRVNTTLFKSRIAAFFDRINIAKYLCCHLFGKEHSNVHRLIVGLVIFFLGFLLHEVHSEYEAVTVGCKFLAYVAHGVGIHPVIDSIKA